MAIEINGARFLLAARAAGVSFRNVVTIGRQAFVVNRTLLGAALRRYGTEIADADVDRLYTAAQGYAEPFLELLGAGSISSLDASSYESASLIHDMNMPIPPALRGAFSLVIDGGCLEHVFDVPRALRNCMEMVQVGGHFVGIAPANNCMGHGFYQFSPELFFRVFDEGNGFHLEQMVTCEIDEDSEWWNVRDPARAGERIEVINAHPTYLLIRAKRIANVPLLAATPQQSDYAASWVRSAEGRPAAPSEPAGRAQGPLRKWLGRIAPASLKRGYRRFWATTSAPYRRAGYSRVETPPR